MKDILKKYCSESIFESEFRFIGLYFKLTKTNDVVMSSRNDEILYIFRKEKTLESYFKLLKEVD